MLDDVSDFVKLQDVSNIGTSVVTIKSIDISLFDIIGKLLS